MFLSNNELSQLNNYFPKSLNFPEDWLEQDPQTAIQLDDTSMKLINPLEMEKPGPVWLSNHLCKSNSINLFLTNVLWNDNTIITCWQELINHKV